MGSRTSHSGRPTQPQEWLNSWHSKRKRTRSENRKKKRAKRAQKQHLVRTKGKKVVKHMLAFNKAKK